LMDIVESPMSQTLIFFGGNSKAIKNNRVIRQSLFI
jgi:hypothetical protein